MIDRLRHQHRELRELSGELLALLSSDSPCDWMALAEARWRLVRLQLQHFALEERFVYRPLERDPRPQVALTATGFIREREAAFARFEEHLDHWTRARISHDWSGFVADARHLIFFTLETIEREEAVLYPLIRRKVVPGDRTPDDRNWAGSSWEIQDKIRRVSA